MRVQQMSKSKHTEEEIPKLLIAGSSTADLEGIEISVKSL